MLDFQVILDQMVVFAVLLAIGFIAAKAGVLTETATENLSKIVLRITLPALVLTMIPNSGERSVLLTAIPMFFLSFVMVGIQVGYGFLTALPFKMDRGTKVVHVVATAFGNSGFVCLPIVLALFGQRSALYISMYIIAEQLLIWTAVVSALAGKSDKASWKTAVKKLINPTMVALLIGILLLVFGIKPQGVVFQTLTGVGEMSKYLSMIYIGGTLAAIPVRTVFKRVPIYLSVTVKMLIGPVLLYLLLTWLCGSFVDPMVINVITLIAASPAMTTIAILSRSYDCAYGYASEFVFLSTVCCMVTIPAVTWIISRI